MTARPAQDLAERDQPVEQSRASCRRRRRRPPAKTGSHRLPAPKPSADRNGDRKPALGCGAHDALDREQAFDEFAESFDSGCRLSRPRQGDRARAALRSRPDTDTLCGHGTTEIGTGAHLRHRIDFRAALQRRVVADAPWSATPRPARSCRRRRRDRRRWRRRSNGAADSSAARRDGPGFRRLEDKTLRRREFGMVRQALDQRAAFDRRCRIDAGRAADAEPEISDRRRREIGQRQG